jgi:hypothetical protein
LNSDPLLQLSSKPANSDPAVLFAQQILIEKRDYAFLVFFRSGVGSLGVAELRIEPQLARFAGSIIQTLIAVGWDLRVSAPLDEEHRARADCLDIPDRSDIADWEFKAPLSEPLNQCRKGKGM